MAETKKRKPYVQTRKLKYDPHEVLALRNVNNLPITDIAKIVGVDPSTIHRFLLKCSAVTHVAEYRSNRADILTLTQAEIQAAQSKLRAHLLEDKTVSQLSEEQKRAWHHTLSIQGNMAHTQERLERGQTTENSALAIRQWIDSVQLPDDADIPTG